LQVAVVLLVAAVSPVISAKRAPLSEICRRTFAWSAFAEPAYAWPQPPNTAKENGAVDPVATWDVNDGDASVPRRSTLPSRTR